MPGKTLKFFHSATCRLGLTYLVIIMVMSVSFSTVFYHTSYHELGRQLPPHSFYRRFTPDGFQPHVENFLQQRINEGRHELLIRLIILNITVLVLGGIVSYLLARRTLEPIEAAMDSQNRFVSDASHELKTPLTAIKASNEVALRKPKLSLADAKKVIEQNSEDAAKLQALAEGLLRLASGSSNPKLTPLSLQEIATETINTVLPLAQTKNIIIDDKTTNIKVVANRQSLQQATTILLDNAIKYSTNGTKIVIDSFAEPRSACLRIVDKGIGIKASDLPHIFERFYRADQSRAKTQAGGYGLGLAIADKLISEQHGEISASSKPGHGSTFTIKLPAAEL